MYCHRKLWSTSLYHYVLYVQVKGCKGTNSVCQLLAGEQGCEGYDWGDICEEKGKVNNWCEKGTGPPILSWATKFPVILMAFNYFSLTKTTIKSEYILC